MTTEYSIQKMVSDGTLSTIALGIQYLQRNDIYVRVAGEETPQSGAPSGYTWSFVNNTTLRILPVVPNGVEVVVYRRTDVDAMYNIYSQNAQFDESTIDENNQQLLYIAQEYFEQGVPAQLIDSVEYVHEDTVNMYYRLKLSDGSYTTEFPIPKGGAAGFEALRRSYADAGLLLVEGRFETGGTLSSVTDVLLHNVTTKAYAWSGAFPHTVLPDTDPTLPGSGYVPRTDALLRNALQNVDGAGLIGCATYAQIRAYSGSSSRINCVGRTNIFDGASGVFAVDVADTTTADDDGYCLVDALGRRWKRVGFAVIDPVWYGAVSDYDSTTKSGTSSSAAFFKAVSLAAAGVKPEWQTGQTYKEVCRTVRPRTGNYKFTTSVPIPSGVIVDLNNSTIGGDGFTNTDCEAFVTGYIDTDGVLKSNLALGDEVGRVMSAQLINWRATNLKKFFNAKNWNESSICSDGYAYNVQQVVKAKRSFYGSVKRIISRGSAGSTALPAFEFDAFVNVMDLDSLFATDRGTTTKISGGVNGLHVRNQSYEGGQDGLTITGECMPMLISSNYFEELAGAALNLGDSASKKSVVVDSNWFFQIGQVAILGNNMQGGKIGSGNYFADNVAVHVNINDVVSTITVEIPPFRYSDTTAAQRPAFPSNKYILGDAVDVKYRVHIFDNSSGVTKATQNYAGDRPMDMPYSGRQGFVSNKIAFCDVSRNGGGASPFTINVDSKIFFDNYVMYTFRIRVVDTNFDRMVSGHGYGNVVVIDHNTGPAITVTAQNVNGYLRLVLSDFNGASFSCEGVLRHT